MLGGNNPIAIGVDGGKVYPFQGGLNTKHLRMARRISNLRRVEKRFGGDTSHV